MLVDLDCDEDVAKLTVKEKINAQLLDNSHGDDGTTTDEDRHSHRQRLRSKVRMFGSVSSLSVSILRKVGLASGGNPPPVG